MQHVLLDGEQAQTESTEEVGDVVEGRVHECHGLHVLGEGPGQHVHGHRRGVAVQDPSRLLRVFVLTECAEELPVGFAPQHGPGYPRRVSEYLRKCVDDSLLGSRRRLSRVAVREIDLRIDRKGLELGEVLLLEHEFSNGMEGFG